MGLFGKKSVRENILNEQEAKYLEDMFQEILSYAKNDDRYKNIPPEALTMIVFDTLMCKPGASKDELISDARNLLKEMKLDAEVNELRGRLDKAVFNETTGEVMYHRISVNGESIVLSDKEFREYCKSHKVDHYNEKGDFVFNPETELAFARTVINQEYVDAMKSGEFDLRYGYKVPEYFDIKKHLVLKIISYGSSTVAFAIFNDTVVNAGIYRRLGKYTNARYNSELSDTGRVFIITDFNEEVIEIFKDMNVYFNDPEYELFKKYNKRFLVSDLPYNSKEIEKLLKKCKEVNEYFREKHGSSCEKITAFK